MPGFRIDQNSQGVSKPKRPVLQHMWIMQNLVGAAVPIGGRVRGSDTDALIYVKSFTPPNYGFGIEDVDAGHLNYKIANKVTWDDVIINFYDTMGLKDWLVRKRAEVWNPREGIRPADQYKFNSILKTLPPNWDGRVSNYIETWVLRNSWISRVSWSELTYTGSDIVNVSVTVSYDWALDSEEDSEAEAGSDGLISDTIIGSGALSPTLPSFNTTA